MPRSLVVAVVALIVALGSVELAVRGLDLFAHERGLFLVAAADDDASTHDAPAGERSPTAAGVLHPYLGFSQRPGHVVADRAALESMFRQSGYAPPSWKELRINAQGFASPIEDYRLLDSGKTTIGIFGGSVADIFATLVSSTLKAGFAERLGFEQGDLEILNFAKGGYKQPQPAIALIQALVSGVPLDLVLEIDGFNEAAMGGLDCAGGYDPTFPSAHHYLSLLSVSARDATPASLDRVVSVRRLRGRAEELRLWLQGTPLQHVEAAKAVVGIFADRALRAAAALEVEAQAEAARDLGRQLPVVDLSRRPMPGERPCNEQVADLWVRSSLAMAALARQWKIPYVHILQPNQYVGGGKPLSAEERATAWEPDGSWARAAATGYPVLRQRARELSAAGVAMQDLTTLFDGRTETLYADPCCHYNLHGNELLAQAVAGVVADRLQTR